MGPFAIAGATIGIAFVICLAVWKAARKLFTPTRIIVFAIAGVLGWMIMLRAYELSTSGYSDAVRRLAVAGVITAWFVLIRDAVRSVQNRDD